MEVLTKTEVSKRLPEIVKKIKDGVVFIHPTDTIYGISCIATDQQAVKKLRKVKEQFHQPLSVWVPSLNWIKKNCLVDKKGKEWLDKLPGPYTIILPLKDKNAVCQEVNLGKDTLGVRQPDHWFGQVVEKCGVPIVTTSANKTGQPFMTSLDSLDPDIEKEVEFMIYEGEKKARPSKIINLVEGTERER